MALQALEIIKSPKITFYFRQLLGIKKNRFLGSLKIPSMYSPKIPSRR